MSTSHSSEIGGATSARDKTLIAVALVPFTALTIASFTEGTNAFPMAIMHSFASMQIYMDLVLAVLVLCFWMHRDASAAGRNPWPWIVGALIVGMFSPLLYLLTRRGGAAEN